MDKREMIKEQVISALRECKPKAKTITGEMRIIKDLGLISDDASEVVHDLERSTGAKPPSKEWLNVFTVDDMIDLLLKYSPPAREAKTK